MQSRGGGAESQYRSEKSLAGNIFSPNKSLLTGNARDRYTANLADSTVKLPFLNGENKSTVHEAYDDKNLS